MKLTNESATAMSLPMPMSTVVSLPQTWCQTQCSRTLISEADHLDEFGEGLLPSVVVSYPKKTGSRP